MKRPCPAALATAALCLGLLAAPAAAQQNIVTFRVESLDRMLEELQDIGDDSALSVDRDRFLTGLLVGLPGGDWLDGGRPIVGILPQMGMMAGDKGIVVALPVADLDLLMAALGEKYTAHEIDGEIHSFSDEDGAVVHIWPMGRYVAAGAMKNFVAEFDLSAALDRRDLPLGVVAIEVALEPIAPFLQMYLVQGREAIKQQIEAEAGDADGDAAGLVGMADLYLDLAADLLNNVSRIQLALSVADDEFLVHKRLVPRSGTTLAEMLLAQQGALPEIARFVDPAEAIWVVAGQVSYTPAFRAAMDGYVGRYGEALAGIGDALDGSAELPGFGSWLTALAGSSTKLMACHRGDVVMVTRISDEGMGGLNVAGIEDVDDCKSAMHEAAGLLAEMPAIPGAEMRVEVDDHAFDHRGVEALALRQTVDMPETEGEGLEMHTYMGIHESLLLSVTGGEDAEQEFRGLVDRVAMHEKGAGVESALFSPVEVGAGFYGRVDVGEFLGSIAELAGSDPGSDPDGADGAGSGVVVAGATFAKDALTIDIVIPTGLWAGAGDEADSPTAGP